jgi:DNA-binding Xre family transcriptional regulator
MGWEFRTTERWAAIRKIAVDEAVAISLDRLEEICKRLEGKA